jgi:hypothetical protein
MFADFGRCLKPRISIRAPRASASPIVVKIVSTSRSMARTAVLAGEGDEEGAAIWRQIVAAVEELQRARRPDEAVN